MFDLTELKGRAAKEGVPQGILEKDFVLSVALTAIAGSDLSQHLVFKGGTAIKKAYLPDARFSEDLDFTVRGLDKEELPKMLSKILDGLESEGVRFGKIELEPTKEGLKAAIKYRGPLGYEQRIRFDFSFRENLVQNPVVKMLLEPYEISGKKELNVLTLEEIFAEKIHALGSRRAPRDLYDVWFLFERGTKLNVETVKRKFAYYGEKFDKDKMLQNARAMSKDWKQDLQPLVKNLPEFELVYQKIKENIEPLLWEG